MDKTLLNQDGPTTPQREQAGSTALFAVVDDAFTLAKFAKNNEYPQEGTPKFFEFVDLCHKLECSLRAAGYETATKGVACSG